ncbi:MAG TPA: NADH-quinone oxidoreductase subunit J [Gammaproteobacteria bacterium]|jgi:NADH-quinone oxidoreductase subunit J|nr:NADH-quinone oxidoreductase subunit J [Gammaproteobacteria bacterium]
MELILFYIAATVALFSTVFALTRSNAAHALIYLIVSLLAVAVIFFLLGAPFAAALEVIVYAGAIMVLFVFVIMMLNLGEEGQELERQQMHPAVWITPAILSAILLVEMVLLLAKFDTPQTGALITAKQVGLSLYGPYVLAVEIASMLLLAGLVGAYHVGRRFRSTEIDEDSVAGSSPENTGVID